MLDKREKIRADLRELQQEREGIVEQLRKAHTAEGVHELALQLVDDNVSYVDTPALTEQISEIDQSMGVHTEALRVVAYQLDTQVGFASVEICKEVRPQFKKHVQKIVEALLLICSANKDLIALRDQLESNGVKTGSLPPCTYSGVDRSDDPTGSRVQWYRNEARESYGVSS